MRSIYLLFFSVAIAMISGCTAKNELAPVSGTVTHEGKPVEKLRICFSPQPVGDNFEVGPFSQGKSDADGKFTLKTRYDDVGAIVGGHTLTFELLN